MSGPVLVATTERDKWRRKLLKMLPRTILEQGRPGAHLWSREYLESRILSVASDPEFDALLDFVRRKIHAQRP